MSLVARLDRPLTWLAGRRLRQMEAVWRDPLPVQERALRGPGRGAPATPSGAGSTGSGEIRGIADYQRRVPVTTYLDIRPLVERAIARRARRPVAGPARHVLQDVGHDRRRQVHPRHARGVPRAPAGADSTRSSWPSTVSGTRSPRRAAALPRRQHPDRAARAPCRGRATSRAWPRGAFPRGSGSATRRVPRSRRSRTGSGAWRPPRGSRASRTSGSSRECRPGCWSCSSGSASLARDPELPLGPALAPPGRLRPRRSPDGSVPERLRGRDRPPHPLRRGVPGVRGLRGHPGRGDRSGSHAHARLRHLLRVRPGRGARVRRPAALDHRRGPGRRALCHPPDDAGGALELRPRRHGPLRLARPAPAGDHRPHQPLRQRVRRERHRRGGGAGGGGGVRTHPTRSWSSSRWRRSTRAAPCSRARHEWAVEFRAHPSSLEGFARAVDETLQALNTDYRTKRAGDVGMARRA